MAAEGREIDTLINLTVAYIFMLLIQPTFRTLQGDEW